MNGGKVEVKNLWLENWLGNLEEKSWFIVHIYWENKVYMKGRKLV